MVPSVRYLDGARVAQRLGCLAALVLAATALAQGGPDADSRRCLECHGQSRLANLPPADRRLMVVAGDENPRDGDLTRPGIYIDYDRVYRASVHAGVSCVACHVDCETLPHAARTEPARCDRCHVEETEAYASSVHAEGGAGAARCSDCHGSHDMLSSLNPQSRTHKRHLPFTCAKCHANPELMERAGVSQPLAVQQYVDSLHGHDLIDHGLLAAPSCNDCHGVHDILHAEDPRSTVHHANVSRTCGRCHTGAGDVLRDSVHGRLIPAGNGDGPVCTTCHTAHEVIHASDTAFKLHSDVQCGQCHADRLARYRETFHGKAIALGRESVAACYDCHGHHDILPGTERGSRLSAENRVETCRRCHPRANENFATYLAHADHLDRENYPVLFWTFVLMTGLIVSVFVFFGIHTALWLVRVLVLFARDPVAFRAQKAQIQQDRESFVRFRPFDRLLHGMLVTSFLLLVATGMPLKFYDAPWAGWMVSLVGGLEIAGVLHRLAAVVLCVTFGAHIVSLLRAAVRSRHRFRSPRTGRFSLLQLARVTCGPDMPVPTWVDVRDWWAHVRWFFGRGERPQFDRWTYWEKFDYFAVFWGMVIIGVSGLILWFPEAFTLVLPGWVINVAVIVHSDEALLAAGFIFTFHFFNVHFRPEKFPLDPVIFSGRMSRTEMEHERKRWYDRLAESGELETRRVRDEWSQWSRIMHPLGFLAFGIGTVLLILIFYAMGRYLLGGH